MLKSTTISFTVPRELRMMLEAVTHIGYYDSVSEFLRDAMRTILQDRKDLRIAIAYELHHKKHISLGKAAEIIGSTIEETKELFKERAI